jgi:hypothetical protein
LPATANPVPAAQRQYLDTIHIPFWRGQGPYPSVKVRLDFRGPDIGDFVYHCHVLEHEEKGMMAIIRVNPATVSTHGTPAVGRAANRAVTPEPAAAAGDEGVERLRAEHNP